MSLFPPSRLQKLKLLQLQCVCCCDMSFDLLFLGGPDAVRDMLVLAGLAGARAVIRGGAPGARGPTATPAAKAKRRHNTNQGEKE